LKLIESNIDERTKSSPAFQYHARPTDRTLVNLYFRHVKNGNGRQNTSIRRAAFAVSVRIPKFSAQSISYTRPSTYY
jgi:hypothetical protein